MMPSALPKGGGEAPAQPRFRREGLPKDLQRRSQRRHKLNVRTLMGILIEKLTQNLAHSKALTHIQEGQGDAWIRARRSTAPGIRIDLCASHLSNFIHRYWRPSRPVGAFRSHPCGKAAAAYLPGSRAPRGAGERRIKAQRMGDETVPWSAGPVGRALAVILDWGCFYLVKSTTTHAGPWTTERHAATALKLYVTSVVLTLGLLFVYLFAPPHRGAKRRSKDQRLTMNMEPTFVPSEVVLQRTRLRSSGVRATDLTMDLLYTHHMCLCEREVCSVQDV